MTNTCSFKNKKNWKKYLRHRGRGPTNNPVPLKYRNKVFNTNEGANEPVDPATEQNQHSQCVLLCFINVTVFKGSGGPSLVTKFSFLFCFCCYAATQLALQLHEKHAQVVCSKSAGFSGKNSFLFLKKIDSGVMRVARGDCRAKVPSLAAHPGSPEAPRSKALPQWTVRLGHMNVVLKCI